MSDTKLRNLERKVLAGDVAALEEFKREWLRIHAVRDEVVREFGRLRYALGELEAAHSRDWKRVQELETMRGSCLEHVESATFRDHAARLERIRQELRGVPDCSTCRDSGAYCVVCGRGWGPEPEPPARLSGTTTITVGSSRRFDFGVGASWGDVALSAEPASALEVVLDEPGVCRVTAHGPPQLAAIHGRTPDGQHVFSAMIDIVAHEPPIEAFGPVDSSAGRVAIDDHRGPVEAADGFLHARTCAAIVLGLGASCTCRP